MIELKIVGIERIKSRKNGAQYIKFHLDSSPENVKRSGANYVVEGETFVSILVPVDEHNAGYSVGDFLPCIRDRFGNYLC